MKITDYKYRQLRAMVNRAKVRKSVKELLHCTLRDYKKQASVPQDGTFENVWGNSVGERCLIGAAVHNTSIYNDVNEGGLDWEKAAQKYFGVTEDECTKIIRGFDEVAYVETEDGDSRPTYASRKLAEEFGKGNRVACLANRLRRELLPDAE